MSTKHFCICLANRVLLNLFSDPLPVRNLIVTASSSMITVTWVPGINSRQDIYTIKYRPLLEKPDAVWLEQTAVTNATQFIAFPGEEYQLSVIAKSKFYSSDPTNASVIVGEREI